MVQIILLIFGIVYAFRRPKIKKLMASQFPQVPPEIFAEWQALELKSIKIFLWATWGLLLIGTPIAMALITTPESAMFVQALYFVLFIVLLVFSAIPGSKASKLKKQYGLKW